MIQERLFALALEYRKTKLWKKLSDSELFGVRLTDGEIGWCCVMGENGGYTSLAVYAGTKGINSYWSIRSAEWTEDPADFQECILSQDCIQCSFGNKDELSRSELAEVRAYAKAHGIVFRGQRAFPQFVRYREYCYPWALEKAEEQDVLCQALAAALEAARCLEKEGKTALGFRRTREQGSNPVPLITWENGAYVWSTVELPGPRPASYPKPVLNDELLTARLRKFRKKGSLQCEILRLPDPVAEEEGEPPRFPVLLFALDRENEYLFPNVPVIRYEEDPMPLLDAFCRELERQKSLPQTIYVRDERTELFFRSLCSKLKIQLVRQRLLPDLEQVKDDFFNHYNELEDWEVPEEMMEEMFTMLMEMDEETLSTMPPPLLSELTRMLEDGVLPEPLVPKLCHVLGIPEENPQEENRIILFPGWKGGN